jgi:putative inorganic carbon (HCO3(-)) transporter
VLNDQVKIKWFYGVTVTYLLLIIYAILQDNYLIYLIPFALIFNYLVLFKLDGVLLFLNFIIPLSIQFDDVGFGLGISLPDEPLIMVIMFLSVFRFIIDGSYDVKVLRHPVTIIIIINLLWYFITAFTSEMPAVSFKYALSRFWYVVVFYFLGIMLFRNLIKIFKYLWLYILPLTFVVLYTLWAHSKKGFTQESSFHISMPFYIAHGIYSAAISFFIPLLLAYLLYRKSIQLKWFLTGIILLLILVFFVGVFYSYTRAAWLSIAVSMVLFVPIILRISFRIQLTTLIISVGLFFLFQEQIFYVLSKNKQDSAEGFDKHLQSASNIRTDASNVERINRWASAINMFKAKPMVGFGPGTYHFKYAPYQEARHRTMISTNFGNQGGAHSEYLSTLAETGFMGLVTLILLLYYSLSIAYENIYSTTNPKVKILLVGITLGLIGYFTHGFLNNYSETDKIAPLVWGGLAIIVAIDVYHKHKPNFDEKPA